MANTDHMESNKQKGVTLQELSDCGINPFAVQLLVESYSFHPDVKPITFTFRGVKISLSLDESDE